MQVPSESISGNSLSRNCLMQLMDSTKSSAKELLVRRCGNCSETPRQMTEIVEKEFLTEATIIRRRVRDAYHPLRLEAPKCTARCKLHSENSRFWDIESVEEGSNEKEDGGERDIRVHGAGVAEGSSGDDEG